MAKSSMITGQYVELIQTPASVGDRLMAAIIDYIAIGIYSVAVSLVVLDTLGTVSSDVLKILYYTALFFPVICYYPACEMLAGGRSIGKMLMKLRVVRMDGDALTVGNILMRWILFPVDTFLTGFLGVVFILFGKHRQRLGDLAAGTIVIKTDSSMYDFFTLNDYSYVQPGYEPTYPEAANLSTKQVEVISRALYNTDLNRRDELVYRLAVQVQQLLGVQPAGNQYADAFLWTVLNDFYHYSSTIQV